MGALKSGAFPVELNGKEYGLLFSLNALDEVQEKFGGYDKLSEVFNKDNPNLFKDTTRMYITPAPTHGTSLSVKSADRQKHRRAAMKKQSGIFLQERA